MWDTINDNLYKAANRIVSHNFFNDEYLERLRIQSPRYTAIKKALRNAKRNKLGESEIKELKSEREQLEKEFKKQRLTFLRGGIPDGKGSIEKSTYDVVRNEFSDVIPSTVVSCLNNNIHKTYDNYRKEVELGGRAISNFKKGLPVPFPIKKDKKLRISKRDDGSIFIKFPGRLEWIWILAATEATTER